MPSYPGGIGLMIGIPYDGKPVPLEYAYHLQNLHPPMNFDVRHLVVKGKPVDVARNEIALAAQQQGIKYLFFNDTDVTVPGHCLRQLIFHLEHWPDFAVVGAIYCHKSPPQMPMVFRGNGIGPFWDWKMGEVFEVTGIGMGATLIRVAALKDVRQPWFKTVDDCTPMENAIPMASMWTEDLWFCKGVTDAVISGRNECKTCQKPRELCKCEGGFVEKHWRIMADGGLLCDHWDNARGIAYSLPKGSKPYQRTTLPVNQKKIVDLGCGAEEDSYHTDEGTVVRVDIREDVKPDYRMDLRKLSFADEAFDIVWSSHTLEHFPRAEFDMVVDEMVRILKKDGELRLLLPNLEWAAQHIMNGEVDINVMNVLYGAQTYEENFHKVGFTPKMIEQLLRQKGFVKFDWQFKDYHMFCRAWINPPVEPIVLQMPKVLTAVEPAKKGEVIIERKDTENDKENAPEFALAGAVSDNGAGATSPPVAGD